MNEEIFKKLSAPFPSSVVKWRARNPENGLAEALPYIDARDVMERLDSVLGPAGWADDMRVSSYSVTCALSIRIDDAWVQKADGAQVDGFSDRGPANQKEQAVKGAYSDAFKRAAVKWGIGRYLYAHRAEKVAVDENGRFKVAPTLPPELLPEDERGDAAEAHAAQQASTLAVQTQAVSSTEDAVAGTEVAAGDADEAARAQVRALAEAAQAESAAQAEATAQADATDAAAKAEATAKAEADAKAAKDAADKAAADKAAAQATKDAAAAEERARADALADAAAGLESSQPVAGATEPSAQVAAQVNGTGASASAVAGKAFVTWKVTEQKASDGRPVYVVDAFDIAPLNLEKHHAAQIETVLGRIPAYSAKMIRSHIAGPKFKEVPPSAVAFLDQAITDFADFAEKAQAQ